MKHLNFILLFLLFLSAISLPSCGGNSQDIKNKDSVSSASSSTTKAPPGDASFSCKIDGKDFSGNGNDSYSNVVIRTAPGLINFVLVKMDKSQQGVPAQFNFFVADHGTTTMHNSNGTDNGSYSAKYTPGGVDNDFGFKEVTVTITSSDASGVKGTFSGILFDPHNKKEISVTDGKFDLPWSPYSKK
jgi:hypothetical protein